MSQLTRKRIILAKIETTYGTDPTPTGAANAIVVRNNIDPKPLNADMVSRGLVRSYLGASDQLVAGQHSMIDFEVELQGSGTAGTAPAYGPLLRACGLSETVSVGTKVDYKPVSTGFESVTIYFNMDGVQHKMTGCRGTVQFDMTAKQIPFMKFSFVGLYNGPTDTALPTPTYTGFKTPLVVNNTNTSGFSFFSYSGIMQSLNINLNNTVNHRTLVGSDYVQISDRQSSGSVVFEAPAIASLDVFSAAIANTLGALAITHGTVSGYKVQFASSTVDINDPTYSDSDGVNMINCPFTLVPGTGNDEFTFTAL